MCLTCVPLLVPFYSFVILALVLSRSSSVCIINLFFFFFAFAFAISCSFGVSAVDCSVEPFNEPIKETIEHVEEVNAAFVYFVAESS